MICTETAPRSRCTVATAGAVSTRVTLALPRVSHLRIQRSAVARAPRRHSHGVAAALRLTSRQSPPVTLAHASSKPPAGSRSRASRWPSPSRSTRSRIELLVWRPSARPSRSHPGLEPRLWLASHRQPSRSRTTLHNEWSSDVQTTAPRCLTPIRVTVTRWPLRTNSGHVDGSRGVTALGRRRELANAAPSLRHGAPDLCFGDG